MDTYCGIYHLQIITHNNAYCIVCNSIVKRCSSNAVQITEYFV